LAPGDGPEPDPLRCALSRPHGVLADANGILYVGDSEAHRIRVRHRVFDPPVDRAVRNRREVRDDGGTAQEVRAGRSAEQAVRALEDHHAVVVILDAAQQSRTVVEPDGDRRLWPDAGELGP
jgi:hypothetical protein